ncbi:MAG: FaeA/PapI family transcriptional regulator [Candidatus Asgardarchaeia archaeon]
MLPERAKDEINSPKIWIFLSDFGDEKRLEEKNKQYLSTKNIHVQKGKDQFVTDVLSEFQTLCEWKKHGVKNKEYYLSRCTNLRKVLEVLAPFLFDTSIKKRIYEFLADCEKIRYAEEEFKDCDSNLLSLGVERFKQFKEKVLAFLRKPREISEIVAYTKVSESNARRWLQKMEAKGMITKTRKRGGIGRPKNIYYLSSKLM